MSTHNTGFHKDLTQIIFQLSSNMHLMSSPVYTQFPFAPVSITCRCLLGQLTCTFSQFYHQVLEELFLGLWWGTSLESVKIRRT